MRRPTERSLNVTVPKDLHYPTAALVQYFAHALGHKLKDAQDKYGYHADWQTDDWETACRAALYEHLIKGDPLDVAAYCAFMWDRGWKTGSAASWIHSPKRAELLRAALKTLVDVVEGNSATALTEALSDAKATMLS